MKRLAPLAGEWIDRQRPIRFSFEGQDFTGYDGDTVVSALTAAGVRLLGRSFKYHRPRGILSAANHDSNVMLQVSHAGADTPNERGDVTFLADGMCVRAANTRGGLRADRLALFDRLSAFLPVGFYYKAFHSKRWFAHWERLFRALTGLGTVNLSQRRLIAPKRYEFIDVLVIGAGPSGLAAALSAAERDCSVLLVDENVRLGGSLTFTHRLDAEQRRKGETLIARVQSSPKIRVLTGCTACGYYADHWVAVAAPKHLIKVRARAVIFAQGVFEQPAVFHNNDLPGIVLASAAQRLLYRYSVAQATRICILTANEQGYEAALDAFEAGICVAAIIDLRATLGARSFELAARLRAHNVPIVIGAAIHAAIANNQGAVAAIEYGLLNAQGRIEKPSQRLAVDGVWMSVGFAPAAALLLQAGARMRYSDELAQYLPCELPAGIFVCGRLNGVYPMSARIADGAAAGDSAGKFCSGQDIGAMQRNAVSSGEDFESPNHSYPIFDAARGRSFVDFDEDIQVKDLLDAIQEGFDSPELLKRYTTVGMGPSQGKHSNLNALRVLARATQQTMSEVTPTTSRPMFHLYRWPTSRGVALRLSGVLRSMRYTR